MEAFVAVLGTIVVLAVLWEVFNDLFHPGGSGALSERVGRGIFRMLRRTPKLLPLAGPSALVVVIASWVVGLAIGFALMYYPAFPDNFRTSTGSVPLASPRFPTVLYFSLATLTTLGYGDFVAVSPLTRLIAACEGLVGFGLLTASVSSIVLVYPAFSRMRLLASSVAHLVEAEKRAGSLLTQSNSDVVLYELARAVRELRIDLVHVPLVYYFAPADSKTSVASWTKDLARFAREGSAPDRPEHVRLAAYSLDLALDDLAGVLREHFVRAGGGRDAVFEALAADHLPGR